MAKQLEPTEGGAAVRANRTSYSVDSELEGKPVPQVLGGVVHRVQAAGRPLPVRAQSPILARDLCHRTGGQ